ncbi:MAG: type II secretion system protein [Planctomycetales bacterium]|nr:type II secretion system protein [Planctomycetales bacterium]
MGSEREPRVSSLRQRCRRALTLIELLVTLTVLAVLAGIIVPLLTGLGDDAALTATRHSLREVRDVIANRYVLDMQNVIAMTSTTLPPTAISAGLPGPHPDYLDPPHRVLSPQLHYLFVHPAPGDSRVSFNPVTRIGWRGPYLLMGQVAEYPGKDPNTAAQRGFSATYGEPGDSAVLDAWGNPFVIQGTSLADAELVSAGPDGDLNSLDDNERIVLR